MRTRNSGTFNWCPFTAAFGSLAFRAVRINHQSPALVPACRANVRRADVKPLTEENIEEIASKLDQGRKRCTPTKELIFRRALREALDILHRAMPSPAGTPSKERQAEPSNRRDTPATATGWKVSSCRDPPKEEGGASRPPQATLPLGGERRSTRTTRASPVSKSPAFESQGLSDGWPWGGVSEAKSSTALLEERQPSPEFGSERGSQSSPKEDSQVKGDSGRKRGRPSLATKRPAQTSTPVPSSRQSCSRPLSAGKKSGARLGLRGKPSASAPKWAAVELAGRFPEEGASPAGKGTGVPNGRKSPGGSGGAHQECNSVGASSSRKRRRRLCLEDSDLEPNPEVAVLEPKREEEKSLSAEYEPVDTSEEEKGWESTSDLSLRLSPIRERSLSPAFWEDDEEDELPSLLPPQEPGSIEAGKLVWCKLPRYPYWPAVVRKVKQKARKASIFLIEKSMEDRSRGFSISLRKLKPFDCQEKQKLIDEARENYDHEINWCINLIEDYRIRVGCCSFRGSFLEYCSDAMSYPVRKEAPHNLSQMNFPQVEEGDSQGSLSETPPTQRVKKVLPDRTRALRDRANGKIVDFIVKAKGADGHLRSVLKNEKPSRWLARFLHARPYLSSVETYLEDDSQQDRVFSHLQGVYRAIDPDTLPLVNGDQVKFILDVLFPEAIIYAISAIDQIDYKKAEDKYIKGPLVSQRERQIFEEEILEQKRKQQTERGSLEDCL
ncbi:PWWP domain-containing DNA repair factor 3A isoform X2 [Pogona vitticeps]